MMLNMIVFDVNYYLWCGLLLFFTFILIIFVVIYVYVMYNLSIISSGTDIKNRKPTFRSRPKMKKLKERLSGAVCIEKNLSSAYSLFVPIDEESMNEGSRHL